MFLDGNAAGITGSLNRLLMSTNHDCGHTNAADVACSPSRFMDSIKHAVLKILTRRRFSSCCKATFKINKIESDFVDARLFDVKQHVFLSILQTVGCDLRIGSDRQVDACGVCGGDGSSCSRPLYHWTLTSASLCSATCGGGNRNILITIQLRQN